MSNLSPTPTVMFLRRQWSDAHLYSESDTTTRCSHCGRRRFHPDHVSREEDKAEVMRWRDRYVAQHGE